MRIGGPCMSDLQQRNCALVLYRILRTYCSFAPLLPAFWAAALALDLALAAFGLYLAAMLPLLLLYIRALASARKLGPFRYPAKSAASRIHQITHRASSSERFLNSKQAPTKARRWPTSISSLQAARLPCAAAHTSSSPGSR